MRIIVAPAKKMVIDPDAPKPLSQPVFLDATAVLLEWMRGLSFAEQKALWRCSDAIARQNSNRVTRMNLHEGLTPAIMAYDGIQYAYMAPTVFQDDQIAYVQEHLRIMSGFYGVLKPMDGVTPYRLEMQAKVRMEGCANLYDFWGSRLYHEVVDKSRIIVNLASKEYSKAIERHLEPQDHYVSCIFGELESGRVVQKGVYAKMARGEMVRFLANRGANDPEDMRSFSWSGYSYDPTRSDDNTYVFAR